MAETTTALYPFDPSGNSPQNRVTKELHSVQFHGNRTFIIPNASPFFGRSIRVYNANTNEDYKEGVDYLLGHIFREAWESQGQPLYGSVVFLNESINPLVGIDYNTVGGKWGHSDAALAEELANQSLNPEQRTWEMIEGLPESYPPIRHEDTLTSIKGFNDLMKSMDDLVEAVKSTAEGNTKTFKDIWERLGNLTAKDVGLGNVPNYPVANDTQSKEGKDDTVFMTAMRTAILIDELVGRRLTQHEQNTDDPHHTTKEQVDLGNVENLPLATREIAEKGESNTHYMTPYLTLYLLRKWGRFDTLDTIVDKLAKHEADRDNPHRLTPAKIGTLTTDEIKDLIEKHIAGDTERFAGKTEEEWLKRIPSQDAIDKTIADMHNDITESLTLKDLPVIDITKKDDPKAIVDIRRLGYGFYAIRKNGDVAVSPNLPIPPDVLKNAVGFNNGDNKNIYVVKNNAIQGFGPDPVNIPTRFRDGNKTPSGIRAVFELNVRFFVLTGDNVLYSYDISKLKKNPDQDPESTMDNVLGANYIQDTLTRYAVIRGNDLEVYEQFGERKATMTLGNYGRLNVRAISGFENVVVIDIDADSAGIMSAYDVDVDKGTITSKVTYSSGSDKRSICANEHVVLAMAPEFGKPKCSAISKNGLSQPYLTISEYFKSIERVVIGEDCLALYDTKMGLHVLTETPYLLTPTF